MSVRTSSESGGVPIPIDLAGVRSVRVEPDHSSRASSRDDDRAWMAAEAAGRCLIHQWTEVLRCLARGPIRVSDIAQELELDKATISHHLGGLRELGLVEFEQRGRDRVFRLGPSVRIVRAGRHVMVRLRLSDLCRMVICVRDLTSDLTPRVPNPDVAISASCGHGRFEDSREPRPLTGGREGEAPSAPRRRGPCAK